jgi:dTDP-4-dehydrorhamnose reductase
MARVLVIGGRGLLGREVLNALRERNHDVVVTSRQPRRGWIRFDAERDHVDVLPDNVDLIINCAGVLASEVAADDIKSIHSAEAVNSRLPDELARKSSLCRARLVHISTDAVFHRHAGRCFEDDTAFATDVYGSTKRSGEPVAASTVVLRCSFVGRDPVRRRGVLEWTLAQTGEIRGYTDQLWNGLAATQVASIIAHLAAADVFDSARSEGSVHHIFEDPPLTKYELVCLIARTFEHDVAVRPTESGRPVTLVLGTKRRVLRDYLKSLPSRASALDALAKGSREE